MKQSKYVAVIHPPKRAEDMEKLLHEISRFRAEKTIKYLSDNDTTGEQLANILQELQNT